MAAIASIETNVAGAFAAAISTLSASDTITFKPGRKQLLVLRNTTAGLLTVTIDGADGTTVTVPGIGSVSVAAGLAVPVAAGVSVAIVLQSISSYLQGVVTLTGASTLTAQLFDL